MTNSKASSSAIASEQGIGLAIGIGSRAARGAALNASERHLRERISQLAGETSARDSPGAAIDVESGGRELSIPAGWPQRRVPVRP